MFLYIQNLKFFIAEVRRETMRLNVEEVIGVAVLEEKDREEGVEII